MYENVAIIAFLYYSSRGLNLRLAPCNPLVDPQRGCPTCFLLLLAVVFDEESAFTQTNYSKLVSFELLDFGKSCRFVICEFYGMVVEKSSSLLTRLNSAFSVLSLQICKPLAWN
jgi:hypothetical protein